MMKLLSCLFAAAWLATAPVQAQQLQPIDGIAAVVDEDVILDNELDRAVNNVITQYAGQQGQLPPRDVLRRQVLERLVLLKLQVARAQSTGIRVDEQEIDRAIAAIAEQNRMSADELRTQVTAEGTSYEEFRSSIRDELLVQRLRQRFAQSQVSVSDAEVDAAMSTQQAGGEQFRLAHILVGLPEGATPEQIQTASEKIDGIKVLLDRGEMDFAAAAVRYSDSPNALEGGDLGWRSAGEIPNAFAELVRGLSPGEVTQPIRGPSGFQLLQLVDVRDASSSSSGPVTQYKARHILIRVPEGDDGSRERARAETLQARIAGGADFAELAREQSEDPSSQAKGGDLGWFTQDQFGPDFGREVAQLTEGQVSAPIRTQAGWHIVELTGTRQAEVDDGNIRNQLRESIGRRKLEDQWSRFLGELRGEAFVDVRDGSDEVDPEPAAPAAGG